jgi:hypothetical protein
LGCLAHRRDPILESLRALPNEAVFPAELIDPYIVKANDDAANGTCSPLLGELSDTACITLGNVVLGPVNAFDWDKQLRHSQSFVVSMPVPQAAFFWNLCRRRPPYQLSFV